MNSRSNSSGFLVAPSASQKRACRFFRGDRGCRVDRSRYREYGVLSSFFGPLRVLSLYISINRNRSRELLEDKYISLKTSDAREASSQHTLAVENPSFFVCILWTLYGIPQHLAVKGALSKSLTPACCALHTTHHNLLWNQHTILRFLSCVVSGGLP
jgi:hypothetical protein